MDYRLSWRATRERVFGGSITQYLLSAAPAAQTD